MITYQYDEKNKLLHIKIYIAVDEVPQEPTEEQLRKALSKMLIDYAKMVEEGKIKILNSKKWGIW
ncbi:hypothetical protein AFV9_gp04 [Betalipothrixvirus uzonense]|uniref:Uncharacterized protein n=1 Tax=Betalipothrixvirus uzonense TaxID=512792 RepID=B2CRI1_9VIRU|nr:hypothetical protein AFV9_gp04 [Acidianus filamentous virus 9]ACB37238.1 hypothetical protein [Acidianus filamentous virus 9]